MFLKSNILLLLLLMFNLFSSKIIFAAESDSSMIKGLELLQKKNFSEAAIYFDDFIKNEPTQYNGYFLLGLCKFHLNEFNKALVYFNKTLSMKSDLNEAYLYRGQCHQNLNNFTFAEGDYLEYLKDTVNAPQVYNLLYTLYLQMKQYKSACKYLSLHINNYPREVDLYKQRALLYVLLDSTEKAITDYDVCYSLNTYDTTIALLKANAYYDGKRYNKAIEQYTIALLLSTSNQKAIRINRAESYMALNLFSDALVDWELLYRKYPADNEILFNMGLCQLQLNNYTKAIDFFTMSFKLNYPNLGQLLTFRGVAYNNLKQVENACSDWQNAYNAGYSEAAKYKNLYCQP